MAISVDVERGPEFGAEKRAPDVNPHGGSQKTEKDDGDTGVQYVYYGFS